MLVNLLRWKNSALRVPKKLSIAALSWQLPLRDMGKKYFAPENQSIVIVGDPSAIGTQLKEYGEFVTE